MMQVDGGATNEQYLNNLLKQTYSTLEPILINEKFHNALKKCIEKQTTNFEPDDLIKECEDYSFITFFKDLYILPRNIDNVSSYLIGILVLLICIFAILMIIMGQLLLS